MSIPLEQLRLPAQASSDTSGDRRAWRQARRALMSGLSEPTKSAYSMAIALQLRALIARSGVRKVAVYAPIFDEPDLNFLWPPLRESGVVFALPRVVAKGEPLEFAPWHEADSLAVSQFGVPEPARNVPKIPLSDIEMMVMPCVGYWQSGHRLGYGGGFYDRTLALWRGEGHEGDDEGVVAPNTVGPRLAIGVAYSECELPTSAIKLATDQPCDVIITPNLLIYAADSDASIFGA
jgi:5-formyltetrahydrofolate cyclo-ligase